jgi:pyridoxamine 5'-phosphate oxidase family protein
MMSTLSDAEISYLKSQRIGRLATVGSNRLRHAVPVGFRYNPKEDAIEIGGHVASRNRRNNAMSSRIREWLSSSENP